MSKIIVMQDTACGPDGNFYAGHKYTVGQHITKAQAEAFVNGRHATYDEGEAPKAAPAALETAEAPAAPETAAAQSSKPEKRGAKQK